MKNIHKQRKVIAFICLLIFSINIFTPSVVFALTNGPTQPEMSAFQPVSTNDMVDLFTGDFRYNIPLLDVGGYPINLSYQSGSTMDDEASWVGFGWNINPGAVNRQLRGLPDDFKGSGENKDYLEKTVNMKPQITKGLSISNGWKLKGKQIKAIDSLKSKLNIPRFLSVGFSYSNYSGIKATLSANAKIGASLSIGTSKTASLGLESFNITTDNQNGATIGGNISLSSEKKVKEIIQSSKSASFGFAYNTNAGLSELTISPTSKKTEKVLNYLGSNMSFIGNDYLAPVELITKEKSTSFTVSAGIQAALLFKGIAKVPAYYNKVSVPEEKIVQKIPAYGMLYAHEGKNNKSALQDFNRENDRPYNKSLPNLPVPVITPDLFNVSSQGFSGQFKLSANGSGIFAGNDQSTKVVNYGLGVEVGASLFSFQGGIPGAGINYNENSSGKWRAKNKYEAIGDFKNPKPLPAVTFKKVGDLSASNADFIRTIGSDKVVRVNLKNNILSHSFGTGESSAELKSNDGYIYKQNISKSQPEKQNTLFSYLTAAEAKDNALDKNIKSYKANTAKEVNTNSYDTEARSTTSGYRKPQHISEITVTDKGGGRQVYGIPAYNITQQDISFSVKKPEDRLKGYTTYNLGDENVARGNDGRLKSKDYQYYYSKQLIPAYASSYLLTAMLSPDYVDVKNDGITDDDLGTAVKFNYSKVLDKYKWRTPTIKNNGTTERTANYNEGLLQDSRDDKASISYGEKEVWYMHSVESKNMVAYFILNDDVNDQRKDGLGVTGINGVVDQSNRLRFLKEIRLYSKSDLIKNNYNLTVAVPVKSVHFEYNYELFNKLPNSSNNGGKLSLKKIYFTFGKNNKGSLNPYVFEYNIPASQDYAFRQYDRWGNYKPETENNNSLNNSEFPYSTQSKTSADLYAGYWQMNKIILPGGGNMEVTYESDDYAYVQNKRAAAMCFIKNIGSSSSTDITGNIIQQDKIYIKLPKPVLNDKQLNDLYFQEMKYLYYKAFVDLDNKGHYEYVPGYAIIKGPAKLVQGDNQTAEVTVELDKKVNPISKSGWQLLRSSLQRLAYPESDNLESDDNDVVKALRALVSSLGRLKDIIENFDRRAERKRFASKIDVRKSWVRLCDPDLKKYGGGSRVKMIKMYDQWAEMTAGSKNNVESASYGQLYEYTTDNPFGKNLAKISSGVASYEPLLGNDENPFRQPVVYSQKRILGLDNNFYLEQPLGESYFPGPVVGYSKVTVKNIGADGSTGNTGSTTSEFYTAKEFPTILEQTALEAQLPKMSSALKLFSMVTHDQVTLSQGYLIINNDMHGKPKSEEIVDKGGQQISAVKYIYKTRSDAGIQRLQSTATVMRPGGNIDQAIVGQDVDFYTDMSQHKTESFGINGEPSFGGPAFWGYWGGFRPNYSKKLYRAAVAVKTIHQTAILEKVIKIEKGSRIESENLVWDAETGEVLLSKSQNEFDDPVYSFTYPAHWAHEKMGPAYRNQGLYLEAFQSGTAGEIKTTQYNSYLYAGDEIIKVSSSSGEQSKFWVIQDDNQVKRIVDEKGQVAQVTGTVKVLRSGCRNMSSSRVGTLVSMDHPIKSNRLNVSSLTKVLDASIVEYKESWTMPVQLSCTSGCPAGYTSFANSCQKLVPQSTPALCSASTWTASQNTLYGTNTYIFTNGSQNTPVLLPGVLWESNNDKTKGPLNRCGIRFPGSPTSKWIGITTFFSAPKKGVYYIGFSGDNHVKVRINGKDFADENKNFQGVEDLTYNTWRILPIQLEAGYNTLEIYAYDKGGEYSIGCEVYDMDQKALLTVKDEHNLKLLFTTQSLREQLIVPIHWAVSADCAPCGPGYMYNASSRSCVKVENTGTTLESYFFNPYTSGLLGNWRASAQYIFDVNRENKIGSNSSTDIRKSGYYSSFEPYWTFSTKWLTKSTGVGMSRWKFTNSASLFNNKGQEIENLNALGQYSSVVFGYAGTFPVAVASNAQQTEVAYDGFEDYNFNVAPANDSCFSLNPHFSFKQFINREAIQVESTNVHSGNFSLAFNTAITINRNIINRPLSSFYSFDGSGRYAVQPGFQDYIKGGFMPLVNKQYILSFWIKDGNAGTSSTNLQVNINGRQRMSNTKKWPMVEGWKRVEIKFLNDAPGVFALQFIPNGQTYIDDVRIYPADGQMKSFVYDETTQKLMAELDENNFTTFYEYDDEGTLIRLKKETEKGIMTLKETRSHYKRN